MADLPDFSSGGKPVDAPDFSSGGKPVEQESILDRLLRPIKQTLEVQQAITKLTPKMVQAAGETAVGGAVQTFVPPVLALMSTAADQGAKHAAEYTTGNKIPGNDFTTTFLNQYERYAKGVNLELQKRMSPFGQALSNSVSKVMGDIVQRTGDKAYEISGSPTVGAGAQAMATFALLGGPMALKPGLGPRIKPEVTPEIPLDFKTAYPDTYAKIESSHIGDAPTKAAAAAAPEQNALQIAHAQMNKELGITPQMENDPYIKSLGISDKLKLIVQKHAAATGENITPHDLNTYVSSITSALEDLQKRMDAPISMAAGKPRITQPAVATVLDEPIDTTVKTSQHTGEDYLAARQVEHWATPDDMTAQLGIGPMGLLRDKLLRYQELKNIADNTNMPLHIDKAVSARKDLQHTWNEMFAVQGMDSPAAKALSKYIAQGGKMSYDEALNVTGLIPKRGKPGGPQAGVLDVSEEMRKMYEGLDRLGPGVTKFAQAGLVKAPNWNGDLTRSTDKQGNVNMYRGTRPGADTTLKPGAWVSPDKDVVTNKYAQGLHLRGMGLTEGPGIVTQHTIPMKDLVYAHKDGYIYAPPGTDIGPVMRARAMDGDPVTFNDLLPYQPIEAAGKPGGKQAGVIVMPGKAPVETVQHRGQKFGIFRDEKSGGWYVAPPKGYDESMQPSISPQVDQYLSHVKEDAVKTLQERIDSGEHITQMFKQRGVLNVELPGGKKLSEQELAKWAVANPAAAAERVKKVMEDNRRALEESRKVNTGKLVQRLQRGLVGHDYDLREALKQTPEGQVALHREVVRNGATMAAKIHMDAANAGIFDKFKHGELQALDEVTRLRRIIQIDKYKGIGVVRHEGGVTGPEANARLIQMKQELGPDLYSRIFQASSDIFGEEKKLLDLRLERGIISQDLYNKLKDFSYTRTEYLDAVDPVMPIASHVKGMPISLRGSGLPELGHGKLVNVNIDSQGLLMEDLARAYNAAFRNDALQAMRNLAIERPDNGIVRMPEKVSIKTDASGNVSMKHTPQGWTSIGVRVAGKQEFILMKDEFAEQFVASPEAGMSSKLAATFRVLSGSSLLKYTSTAANPKFVLAGLPMDIWHTWVASSGTYSPHFPVALAQMGADMAATLTDAFGKKGAWIDAMNEGMGSSYMTHYSRGLTDPMKTVKGQMQPRMEKLRESLAYLNEVSDMWIRLAYRHRLMEQGVASWEATAMARDRLDYYQGGQIAKAVDSFIPYTNVTIQATAKGYERLVAPLYKDIPEQYALKGAGNKYTPRQEAFVKTAWIIATAATAKLAAMATSPETDKSIPVMDKVRNYNITFGDQLYITDPNGNKRYLYLPIRLDQVVMPYNAAVVGGLEYAEYGKVPQGIASSALGQVSPISSYIPIPSIEAVATYVHNYDDFTDSPVYKGPRVQPQDEVRSFGTGEPTNPLFVGMGQATGASPMRLQAAVGKVINEGNFYIQAFSFIEKKIMGDDPRMQSEVGLQVLSKVPGMNSLVKLTTPGTQQIQDLMDMEAKKGSEKSVSMSGLNDLIFQYEHHQNGVTQQTLETYINNQPADVRKMLVDHTQNTVKVDQVMGKFAASDKIPSRAWWIAAGKTSGDVRAQAFYSEWVSAEPAERQRMIDIAGNLGWFNQKDFRQSFLKERQMLGDAHR